MRRMRRIALPLLAIAAVLALVSVPSGQTGAGPYLSALSDLAASPALAAGGCGNRACDFTKFRTCYNNPGTHCDRNVKTAAGCATIGC